MSEQLEKRCSKCEIVKPIEQFSRQRQPNGREGRRSQCKACIKVSSAAYLQANSEKKKTYQSTYSQESREKINACYRERDRVRKANDPEYRVRKQESSKKAKACNPEKYRKLGRKGLLKRYNLTVQEYEQMYQAQNGLCAVCGNPQVTGKQLSVDHDHVTGLVRGLLCVRCNYGIGYFQENISFLENAIAYLHAFHPSTDVS